MIDAVIPVDLSRRPRELLARLRDIMTSAHDRNLGIVIGHNDRNTFFDRLLKKLCAQHRVRIASDQFYRDGVNNALLRNVAASLVDAPHMLLMDADLYIPHSVLSRAATGVKTNDYPFRILPCLYLSRSGTAQLQRNRVAAPTLINDYLGYRRSAFLHLAVPSSVTVLRTEDYFRAGEFDTRFFGHGYEDLDFLVRLAWLHGLIPRTPDLLTDSPSRAPLMSIGFRGYLVRLTLPALLRREVAFHLWHSTRRDDYYRARSGNAEYFLSKLSSNIDVQRANGKPDTPRIDVELISKYLDICREADVDPHEYSILFENRPGHADRLDTVWRRMKFLANSF